DVREAAHWWMIDYNEGWMIDYNEARSHDSLGGMTPVEYRNKYAESSTFEVPA
ncbi:IS3 family transposase, partial [Xanthomonas perforans]|uniref:IS3 family transposase n=1 Tax=Xanthomonas perforans TaxID=442694 RepID=UPI0011A2FE09